MKLDWIDRVFLERRPAPVAFVHPPARTTPPAPPSCPRGDAADSFPVPSSPVLPAPVLPAPVFPAPVFPAPVFPRPQTGHPRPTGQWPGVFHPAENFNAENFTAVSDGQGCERACRPELDPREVLPVPLAIPLPPDSAEPDPELRPHLPVVSSPD